MTISRPLKQLEQSIVDKVDRFGCMVMHVFDAEGVQPAFSYSIGFPKNAGQPEVLIYGLEKTLMHAMINELFRQCRDEGLVLAEGAKISGLLDGFDCIAREISSASAIDDHFRWATWYGLHFGSGSVSRAFQIVWPGARQGLFPWEEGCASSVIEDQPALYEQGTIH